MNKEMNYDNDEIEIDLWEVLMAWKRKWWAILLAAVVCGGLTGAFSKFVITPQYTSQAMLYILSKETTLTSLADLQIGSQLTQDYKIIVTSRPVLEDVISQFDLNLEYKEMVKRIEIENPNNTRILTIAVQDPDPYLAKNLADAVAKTASEYIGDLMEMVPPKIIEQGVVATEKTSPSNGRNALIGAVIGMVLVCGALVLQVIMNDTIRTEEDVAKYLGLTVLALVPEKEQQNPDDIRELKTKGKPKKKNPTSTSHRKGGAH